ncbi:MAG: PilZ domain-containing protein [Deltaproteobacteria bacterium]|nr:PilZ domain-containing protein [Deltaproteobacteria bacterium]
MPKFVVVANSEAVIKTITDVLQADGADAIALSSLAELPAILREVPVNGILLDLVTSAKATAQEKRETNELIQLYPHAKTKVIDHEVKILGNSSSFQHFIQECRSFTPRVIRRGSRQVRFIGFLLSTDSDFTDADKTVTLNISDDGCFVYSTGEWKAGDRVWLRFSENECVVQGVVRWWQPWGNNKRMPGIGIRFEFSQA